MIAPWAGNTKAPVGFLAKANSIFHLLERYCAFLVRPEWSKQVLVSRFGNLGSCHKI